MRKFLLRAIAVSEIGGAMAAFGFECWSLVLTLRDKPDVSLPHLALDAAFCFALSALTVLAGVALWRLRPSGLKWSLWAQAAQIPQLVSSALTYKAELGLGVWIFCHVRTGFVGITAGALNIDTTLVFAGTGAPKVAINVLALGFLICLWRAHRAYARTGAVGEDEESDPAAPRSRRALRFVAKTLLVLFAIVAVPVFAWWIYNRIDEASTPQAQHWFAPLPHTVADNENAWLYLLGLGAAADEEPLALGKRIVDAHNAREARLPRRDPDDAEKALRKGALPYVGQSADGHDIANVCPGFIDCVQWALDHSAQLDELAQANALRLQRYATALAMPKFEEFAVPALNDPIADIGDTARLTMALIQRDLALPARRAAALTRLGQVAAFWRRVDEQAMSEIGKLLSERQLDTCAQLLDAALNHWGPALLQDANYAEAAAQILAAHSAAQRDYEKPLRYNAVMFAHVMASHNLGIIDAWRYCEKSCLQSGLIAQAYLPQATNNLQAQLLDLRLEAFNADPRVADTVGERGAALIERNTVSNDAWRNVELLSYNMAGKTLAIISMPAYAEFIHRRHDLEARRRLLLTKAQALLQHVAPSGMPAFLAAQPEDLRNPYNGEPFEWNAAFSELRFVPKAKFWKRTYLAVAYPDVAAPVVAACSEAVSLRVFVSAAKHDDAAADEASTGNAAAQPFDLFSCAGGVRHAVPSWLRAGMGEALAVPDVQAVTLVRHGAKLDARVVLSVAKDDWRSFDALDLPLQRRTAAVAVDASDLHVDIEARALRQAGLLRVDARAVPARQLATQLAKAGNIKLAGEWTDMPVSFQAEGMTAAAMLERLAKTAGAGK